MRIVKKSLFSTAGQLLCIALLASSAAQAEQVVCHYTFGGETKSLVAPPTNSPYAIKGIKVGSFFHFRVIFQNKPTDLASIKIYTYTDHEDDPPVLIHQASYPYPLPKRRAAPYGFSGLHFVYEPVRDGELQYWCELKQTAKDATR